MQSQVNQSDLYRLVLRTICKKLETLDSSLHFKVLTPFPVNFLTMQQLFSPTIIRAIGQILAVSYPLLALSAGARAIYQLFFKKGVTDYFPPTLSAVAALLYLFATLAFVIRQPWAWWISVTVLSFETAGVLLVGTLSFVSPDLIGHTVWHNYGSDYGFLPLLQPILGLIWLFWPDNRRLFFRQPSIGR